MTDIASRPPGCLYIVAVPIGDPEDFTLRARRVLAQVDWILAEDPAQTQRLLAHHRLSTPVTSYHPENKEEKTALVLARLGAGESMALVCDGGTPLICDPGSHLVAKVREAGLPVVPAPGVSPLVTALSVAGVPAEQFVFHGVVPTRGGPRRRILEGLGREARTQVLYVAPRDLRAVLTAAGTESRERTVVVAADLTRTGESIVSGTIRDLLRARHPAGGELTVVVGPLDGRPAGRDRPRRRAQPSVSGRRRISTR